MSDPTDSDPGGHVTGFGNAPPVAALESKCRVRMGEVPGIVGLYLKRRRTPEGA